MRTLRTYTYYKEALLIRRYLYPALMSSLLAMAALAVPAVASAAPQLANTAGTPVSTGSALSMSGNLKFGSGGGYIGPVITCATNVLAGTLTTNSGGTVAEEITSGNFSTSSNPGGRCSSSNGAYTYAFTFKAPWCLKSTTQGVATVGGCGAGSANLHIDVYTWGFLSAACDYTMGSMSLGYKSNTSPLTLGIQKFEMSRTSGGASCTPVLAAEGSFTATQGGNNLQMLDK
jgi:hypothetical protein